MRQKISLALLMLLLPVLFWSLMTFEERSIYHPESTDYAGNPWQAIRDNQLEKRVENVFFYTPDGVKLNGWYTPARSGKPTIVFTHGNGGGMADRIGMMTAFTQRGYGFFVFDYRGYGISSGSPSEAGLYQDFKAASEFLTKQKHLPQHQQIVMGESLGSAVALERASLGNYKAVILFSAMTSAPEVAIHVRKTVLSGSLRWLPLEKLIHQEFNALSHIQQVQSPLLILHGTADEMMPVSMPEKLYQQAGSPYKKLVLVPGAGHNDVFFFGEASLFSELERLLKTQP